MTSPAHNPSLQALFAMWARIRQPEKVLLAVAVAGAAIALLPTSAGAHKVAAAYRNGTYPGSPVQVQWWFETSFPGRGNNCSPYKNAVLRASHRWNAYGRRLEFVDHGCREKSYPDDWFNARFDPDDHATYCERRTGAARTPVSLVFWDDDVGGLGPPNKEATGEATTCNLRSGYRPSSFILAINSKPKLGRWYTGTSFAVPGRPNDSSSPNARYDLDSAAMHELGHATGWVPHYDDRRGLTQGGAVCGMTSNRETMCRDGAPLGVAWGRTLGRHDRETFFKAYGPR